MLTAAAREKNNSGMSRLGTLILILLISAGVFVGYHVFPFYYYYYEIQGLMEAQADKATIFTDSEIRKNLMERIKKLELPIDDPEDLHINRFDGKIVIEMKYEEVLFIDYGEKTYNLYVFEFNPHAERVLGKSR